MPLERHWLQGGRKLAGSGQNVGGSWKTCRRPPPHLATPHAAPYPTSHHTIPHHSSQPAPHTAFLRLQVSLADVMCCCEFEQMTMMDKDKHGTDLQVEVGLRGWGAGGGGCRFGTVDKELCFKALVIMDKDEHGTNLQVGGGVSTVGRGQVCNCWISNEGEAGVLTLLPTPSRPHISHAPPGPAVLAC